MSYRSLTLYPEFAERLALLSQLGYVSDAAADASAPPAVTAKGRVACELAACDELLLTEALTRGLLHPLDAPELAALLAAFVYQERADERGAALAGRLAEARDGCLALQEELEARGERVTGAAAVGAGGEARPPLNFGLSALVYEWACGRPFRDIIDLSRCALFNLNLSA